MRRPPVLFVILLIQLHVQTRAQSTADTSGTWMKGWNIAPVFSYGKIIKHTPKFGPTIDHPSLAFELVVSKQMHGTHSWEYAHHYPFLGFAVAYNNLGNDSVIGNAVSILPFIEIPVAGGKNLVSGETGFSASFRVGTGFALISEYYDPVENPGNNVIASKGNNITQFAFAGQYKSSDYLTFMVGASLTHYSSGAVRVPNLGINIPALRVGLRYQPKPLAKNEYLKPALPAVSAKVVFNIQTGLGFQEAYPPYGPMYHVYLFEASAGKMLARWDLLSLGAQVSYKEAAYAFIRQQELYPDHYFTNSLAASAFLKNDFLFGPIGIAASLGYCYYHPSPLQIAFYQKLGAYYSYRLGAAESVKRLNTGVYLTAGDFTADYVSVEIGFRF